MENIRPIFPHLFAAIRSEPLFESGTLVRGKVPEKESDGVFEGGGWQVKTERDQLTTTMISRILYTLNAHHRHGIAPLLHMRRAPMQ